MKKEIQGSPESNKQTNKVIKTILKITFDLALFVFIFIAGATYGDNIIGNECPPIELVEKCYVNTLEAGVVPIEEYLNYENKEVIINVP